MGRHRYTPVETKVGAATGAAYLTSSGLLAVLGHMQDGERLLDAMPDSASALVLALVPAILTFAAGWSARHTPRMERQ